MSNFFKNIHPLLRRGKRKDEYDDSNFAVLNALNYELTQAEQETISSKIHSSLESATGEFLDAWGAWFGVYRKDGWTDEYYRKRIIRELLLKRGTVPAIIEALVDFLEDNEATVTIYEPWRNIFYTNKSDLNGEDHLMGYYYRFAIIDISIDRPFPPEIVEVIQSFKPAGVLFYIRLDTSTNPNTQVVDSPYVYLDVNNKTEIEQWLGLKYDVRGNVNLNNQVRDVVDSDFFITNDSALNGTDVLTGSFNHARGYLHLATNPTLTPFKPTAETTLSELNTALGESTQDMYLFTEHIDDRTASIKVPQIPKEGLGYAVAYANSPDGSTGFIKPFPNPNIAGTATITPWSVNANNTVTVTPAKISMVSVGSSGFGFRTFDETRWEASTNYVLSYKFKVTSGAVASLGGHFADSSTMTDPVLVLDDQGTTVASFDSYSRGVYNFAVGETYKVIVPFRTKDSITTGTQGIFVQPNRADYNKSFEAEVTELKLEKGTVATPYIPDIKDDPINGKRTYVGVAPAESNNYADYTWYPITNNNTFLYVAFDVKSYIQTYFKAEYDTLRLTLSEEDAMNKLLGNPVISNRIRAMVSPSSAINFKLSIYDVTDDAWFSLGTTKLDTYFQKNNIKFNRAVDYINTEGLMFFQLEFTRRNLETTVELDMLNFTFDCRLGDGYEIGLQSEVSSVSETWVPDDSIAVSPYTIGQDNITGWYGANIVTARLYVNDTYVSIGGTFTDGKFTYFARNRFNVGDKVELRGLNASNVEVVRKIVPVAGGVNLLLNSSFANNMSGWANSGSFASTTSNGEYTRFVKTTNIPSRVTIYQNTVTRKVIKAGTSYALSLQVYIESVSGANSQNTTVFLRTQNSTGFVDSPVATIDLTKVGTWQTLTATGVTRGEVGSTLTLAQATIALSGDLAITFRIKNFKIEEGTASSPWTPAPEDSTTLSLDEPPTA